MIRRSFLLGASAVLLAACAMPAVHKPAAGPEAARAQVVGTVSYRERIAIPDSAHLELTLADASRADAMERLAYLRIHKPGQVPIRFAVDYDPARVKPNAIYSLNARLIWDGKVRFANGRRYTAILEGKPQPLDVQLEKLPE